MQTRILSLVFLIMTAAHWIACGYVLLAHLEQSEPTWIDQALAASYSGGIQDSQLALYSDAFYQVLNTQAGNKSSRG